MRIEIDPEELRPLIEEIVRNTVEAFLRAAPRPSQAQPARQPQSDELLTRDEAAAFLKVSVRTIDHHVKCGRIRASKVGNVVRIARSDVAEFVAASAL